MSKHKVSVTSPPREGGFKGIWVAGKHWPTGRHEAEVTDDELHKLSSDSRVLVEKDGKVVQGHPSPGATPQTTGHSLTAEELALVEQHRAANAKTTSIPGAIGPNESTLGPKHYAGETMDEPLFPEAASSKSQAPATKAADQNLDTHSHTTKPKR